MSEINIQGNEKKSKRLTSRSTRVDLTPMVDLGFILVTFFVFTSALSEPLAMELEYPNDKDSKVRNEICQSCVITLLPVKDNKLWYYEGNENTAQYKQTSYAYLRTLLINKKQKVIQQRGTDQFQLIIRPLETSQYHNLVDIMDDCAITGVARYFIDEPSEKEVARFQ